MKFIESLLSAKIENWKKTITDSNNGGHTLENSKALEASLNEAINAIQALAADVHLVVGTSAGAKPAAEKPAVTATRATSNKK